MPKRRKQTRFTLVLTIADEEVTNAYDDLFEGTIPPSLGEALKHIVDTALFDADGDINMAGTVALISVEDVP